MATAAAAVAAAPKRRKGLFASVSKLLALPGSGSASPKAGRRGGALRDASLGGRRGTGGGGSESSSVGGGVAQAEDAADADAAALAERAAAGEHERLWAELASTAWCPVLREPPAPGLPWLYAADTPAPNTPPLAPPRVCRPASDAWLASSSRRLVDGAPRTPALLERLGWRRQLPGALLGAQLAAVGELHSAPVAPESARLLAEHVPRLYGALASAGPQEVAAASAVVAGRPCVWVGSLFVPADRVAFKVRVEAAWATNGCSI